MGLIKSLAVIGGAGLVVNELSKTKKTERSANVSAKSVNVIDSQKVKEAILSDPTLLSLVRGEKGEAGNGYKAGSTTSITIGIGAKTLDVSSTKLAYSIGARVRIAAVADPSKWMEGVLTAYSGTNLTVNVDSLSGSGTIANWNVNLAGERGLTGIPGLAGEAIQNYCDSLLKNGALESGSTDGWTGGVIGGDTFEGMRVLEGNNLANANLVYLNLTKLYKVELVAKGTGTLSVFMFSFSDTLASLEKSNGNYGAYFLQAQALSSGFQKFAGYVGGVGINTMNLAPNTVKGKFQLAASAGGSLKVSKLVLKEVSLGEPVPYNLPFLPKWQMVYDPTTGDLGIYNGTAIVWVS